MNVAELKALLAAEGFDPATYSIESPLPAYEGLILRRADEGWVIEHFERGMRRPLESWQSEDEACRSMHALMTSHFS